MVRMLRRLCNAGTVSLIGGVGGGLLAGWIVSKQTGGWLTPLPWIVYAVILVGAVAAVSVLWPSGDREPERGDAAGPGGADQAGSGG